MAESYVGIAPDGSGKKIRNLQAIVVQPDGTLATVQMQVVALVDMNGNAVDWRTDEVKLLLMQIVRELQAIREMYGYATGTAGIGLAVKQDDYP